MTRAPKVLLSPLLLLTVGLVLVASHPCDAQPVAHSFAALTGRLKPGDTIFVIDRHGRESRGKLTRLSPESLVLANNEEREIASSDIGRIEKPDSIWDGAIVGFGMATPPFLFGALVSCDRDCGRAATKATIAGVAIGGLLGARIDKRHEGRRLVYSADDRPDHGPVRSFADLWTKVKTGDWIFTIDKNGRETAGIFVQASDATLTLLVDGQSRQVAEADVRQIVARQSDSAGKGLRVGATLGAALGLLQPTGGSIGGKLFLTLYGAAAYGAIGAGIGMLFHPRTTVFNSTGAHSSSSVTLVPLVSADRKGAIVVFSF